MAGGRGLCDCVHTGSKVHLPERNALSFPRDASGSSGTCKHCKVGAYCTYWAERDSLQQAQNGQTYICISLRRRPPPSSPSTPPPSRTDDDAKQNTNKCCLWRSRCIWSRVEVCVLVCIWLCVHVAARDRGHDMTGTLVGRAPN